MHKFSIALAVTVVALATVSAADSASAVFDIGPRPGFSYSGGGFRLLP